MEREDKNHYINTIYFDEDGIEFSIHANYRISEGGYILLNDHTVRAVGGGAHLMKTVSHESILHAIKEAHIEQHGENLNG